MLEKELESRLKKEIEKLGCKFYKFISPNMGGVPDRLVLIPNGKAVFVEMKRPGGILKPLQKKRKKEIEKLGFEVWVVDTLSEITRLVESIVDVK
ncbi:MAG: hypothetical protein H6Q67_1718 [Firmicutes bacterium]|nr:hypothetical protein [Bacillota bacterium]